MVGTRDIAHHSSARGTSILIRTLGNTLEVVWQPPDSRDQMVVRVTAPANLATAPIQQRGKHVDDIDPTGRDLLISHSNGPGNPIVSEILDTDTGLPRYQLAEETGARPRPGYRVFLDDELVEVDDWADRNGSRELRSWSRIDGSVTTTTTVESCGQFDQLATVLPVPGATIVVCPAGSEKSDDSAIVGFGAGD